MAKLPNGVLGPFSGKIGPIVGATWHGVPYIRSKPKAKKKKQAIRSPRQIANESKFKFSNRWMIPFHPFIMVGFSTLPPEKPPISMAFAINFRDAVVGAYPEFGIDYSKVVLSIGDLPGLQQPVVTFSAPDKIELRWEQSDSSAISFDDQVMLAIYSRELSIVDGFIGGVKRMAGHCSFQLSEPLIGKALDVYISVSSLNRKKMAKSIYLGLIAP